MDVFKIRQDGFKEIRKKMLSRSIPLLLIAGAVGIAISVINTEQSAQDVNVLPFVIPLMVVMLGFGLYRGINRQKLLFESYKLTIDNNNITREQLNTPTISIYFNDIQEIARHKNGNIIIKGKEAADQIGIPPQIEEYARLEAALQQIQPIVRKDKISIFQKYQSLAALIAVGLMLCVYTVNNKIIVGLTGTALVVMMVWSLVKIRSSKNIDRKTKRGAWLVLIVLASVIATMVLKLTGFVDAQHL